MPSRTAQAANQQHRERNAQPLFPARFMRDLRFATRAFSGCAEKPRRG
jgi:hypothetical protein